MSPRQPERFNPDLARVNARLSIIDVKLQQILQALTKLQAEADEARLHRILKP